MPGAHPLTRKHEELLHHFRGAMGGLQGVVESRFDLIACVQAGEFEIADGTLEHVVEIVRDAGGELAHSLHLMCLKNRLNAIALVSVAFPGDEAAVHSPVAVGEDLELQLSHLVLPDFAIDHAVDAE